jgi:hypothetical protein
LESIASFEACYQIMIMNRNQAMMLRGDELLRLNSLPPGLSGGALEIGRLYSLLDLHYRRAGDPKIEIMDGSGYRWLLSPGYFSRRISRLLPAGEASRSL